jgi:hypothetical protein
MTHVDLSVGADARHPLVLAHAFGTRYELPIPLWMFVVGGATVVLLSFALVLRRPAVEGGDVSAPDLVPATRVSPVAGPLSVLVTMAVAVVGLTGTQEVSDNLAPLFFWIVVWIGLPLSCGLLGDWTRPVNPFATLARVGDDARLRKAVLARKQPLEWGFGWWPAFGLFVLLVLGELVFNLDATKPAFVGGMLIVYAIASFFLGLLFGPGWLQRGEVFSAIFNAWGRLGFFRFGAPGVRGFAGGLRVPFEPVASRVLFVLLLLVSINFDGLLATPQWQRFELRTYGTSTHSIDALRTLSLLVLVVIVLAVFLAFALGSARAGGVRSRPFAALAGLLPSLVPIAYGYLIAHYLQYLLIHLQELYPLVQNPGYGNTDSGFQVHTGVYPNSVGWYVSLSVIVIVHVIAVVLAHRHLAGKGADERATVRSEYPWLVAMVAYTAFSLFLIAQPLTQESGSATQVQSVGAAR